jgi:F-box protein 39
LPNIEAFTYVFPCDFARQSNEVDIYGTGGEILQGLKNLLVRLPGLKRVELFDLQLEPVDAAHVLDEVSEVCCFRLTTLRIVNISRDPYQMLAIAGFVNLKVLAISPQNLGDDLVECLGKKSPGIPS